MATVCERIEQLSIYELEENFSGFDSARDKAEVAFAIATRYNSRGNKSRAEEWGKASIYFFKQCEFRSITDCGPAHPVIGGVNLPDIIHDGVVAQIMQLEWGIMP